MENWREETRTGHTYEPVDATIRLGGLGRQLADLRAQATPPDASDNPVFVDESGRRGKTYRRLGWFLAAVCAVYAVTLVVAVLGGNSSAPWLPISEQGQGQEQGHEQGQERTGEGVTSSDSGSGSGSDLGSGPDPDSGSGSRSSAGTGQEPGAPGATTATSGAAEPGTVDPATAPTGAAGGPVSGLSQQNAGFPASRTPLSAGDTATSGSASDSPATGSDADVPPSSATDTGSPGVARPAPAPVSPEPMVQPDEGAQ
ncbi:hypothetical protein [Streptomyces nitrosporeus]|uniref:hypothetical protein n=1 Tax=Streptomyces nitrosporeus TaxID=28894 RepID=UPI0039A03998